MTRTGHAGVGATGRSPLRLICFITFVGAALLAACGEGAGVPALSGLGRSATARDVAGGDARRGAQALREYGCGACHVVPGVLGARGLVGPPLNSFARRTYVAGNLPNTPPNLIRWIRVPQAVEPGTAMPDLDVTEADARDIAAYLYTLK